MDVQTCQVMTNTSLPTGQHPSQRVSSAPFLRLYLYFDINLLNIFLVMCSHYVSSYDDHYHSISTVVCSRVLLITLTVALAPTSVGELTSGQQDAIL